MNAVNGHTVDELKELVEKTILDTIEVNDDAIAIRNILREFDGKTINENVMNKIRQQTNLENVELRKNHHTRIIWHNKVWKEIFVSYDTTYPKIDCQFIEQRNNSIFETYLDRNQDRRSFLRDKQKIEHLINLLVIKQNNDKEIQELFKSEDFQVVRHPLKLLLNLEGFV